MALSFCVEMSIRQALCLLLGFLAANPGSAQSLLEETAERKHLELPGHTNLFPSESRNHRFLRDLSSVVDEDVSEGGNCSDIHNQGSRYNGSLCELVREECDDKYELLNYLEFVVCGLGESLQPLGFVILGLWLIYLLSLLSTTVDKFFVPVLQMMSQKLHLPPSIAGMTLLALGNGAPDIFVAFSALTKDDDLPLVLGALLGAGLFIISVVLGTVLMVSKSRQYNIDKIDFMRDIIAYMVVLVVIVGVSVDGKVYLAEVAVFPVTYVGYVMAVLGITVFRKWYRNRKNKVEIPEENIAFNKEESLILIKKEPEKHPGDSGPVTRQEIEETIEKSMNADKNRIKKSEVNICNESEVDTKPQEDTKTEAHTNQEANDNKSTTVSAQKQPDVAKTDLKVERNNEDKKLKVVKTYEEKKKLVLHGLTWPDGWFQRIQFVIEWPFSLLRWLTIPPCSHDGNWSVIHYLFAVFSPIPMALLFMVVLSDHWSVYETTVGDSAFPVPVLVIICVAPLCIPLMLLLKPRKPPNKVMQVVLMIAAFIMSICWLYLIADEVVSVLQALGLLASISTAILGLTVLAIGNSVADWVADTIVSLNGKPEMALASCFGAPLITHVIGLSFAFLAKMIADGGHVYEFDVLSEEFVHVKMAWIFLGIVLLGSTVIFPLFKFSPPREYGVILMYIYCVFMVFSVLIELDIMRVFI